MYDIAIIGGGINGCGIARDAAGRGYSVFLAEMGDLASGTSSWSTKLVHGGLRYLEHYEFRLVREALAEREVLLALAPHLIRPLRFVLPHHAGLRPAWLLRLGLFLYDHIGGRRTLPGTRTVNLRAPPFAELLCTDFVRGFAYSDCAVDDTRLVILTARDAADRGAKIKTRTKVTKARRTDGSWHLELASPDGRPHEAIRARLIVNAAGPWVDAVQSETLGLDAPPRTRLVKGSHILVPRIGTHEEAFIFQNADGRIIFAIPYQGAFTLIGTTDEDYTGDPAAAAISAAEIDYLCRSASTYFRVPVRPEAIAWTFSGVRPLYDDGATQAQEATRDYVLDVNAKAHLVTIFGGKITTYRRLAEDVMARIASLIGRRTQDRWTAGAPLPGGDFPVDGVPGLVADLARRHPYLGPATAERLVMSYGTMAHRILDGAKGLADLGASFGAGLTEREVDHLIANEWAMTADDILWRRSKLGLKGTAIDRARLEAWLAARCPERAERSAIAR